MWDAAVRGGEAWDGVRSPGPAPETAGGRARESAPAQAREQPAQTDLWTPGREEEKAPSLWEMMREARERAEEVREKFSKLKAPVRYGDIPVEAYARLARARSRGDVGAAQGYARRQISRLKAALRQDTDNRDAIQAAIVQLEKAVCRAGRKKRQLEREQLLQTQRRKAEEQRRTREELRLRQDLKRRAAARMIQKSGYLNEAVINQQMRSVLAAQTAKWQLGVTQSAAAPSAAQGAAAYAASAAPAEQAAPAAGIEAQA